MKRKTQPWKQYVIANSRAITNRLTHRGCHLKLKAVILIASYQVQSQTLLVSHWG